MDENEILDRWYNEMRRQVIESPGTNLTFELAKIMRASGATVTDQRYAQELWDELAGILKRKGLVILHPPLGRGVDKVTTGYGGTNPDNWSANWDE